MDLETARKQYVLELRIHGIGNSPPASTLDLDPGDVEMTEGDTFGSFWTPTASAASRDQQLAPGQLHHIPANVRREAYSWGQMARASTSAGGGTAGRIWAAVIRAMRAGIVPFGITNAAYWARAVPPEPPDETERKHRPEPTAAMVRLFGLVLTFLMVASLTTVAVSIVGNECYGVAAGEESACRDVPGLGFLSSLEHGQRVGLLSLFPVLVMIALVLAGRATQVKYDERVSATRAAGGPPGSTGPLLYRAGFWARRPSGPIMLVTHLGAAMALVAVLLSWTEGRLAVQTGVMIAGGVVIGLAALLVSLRTDDYGVEVDSDAWRGRLSFVVLVAGALTWVLAWWTAALPQQFTARALEAPSSTPQFVGIDVVPSILGVLMIGVAATGLVWRHHRSRRAVLAWAAVPLVATGMITFVALTRGVADDGSTVYGGVGSYLVIGASVLLAVPAVWAVVPGLRKPRRFDGWNGSGPGVFLLLGAGIAATYSSLVVLGAQALLDSPDHPAPAVPSAFAEFGMASIVIPALLLVLSAVVTLPAIYRIVGRNPGWIPMASGTVGDRRGPTGWSYLDIERNEWQTEEVEPGVRRLTSPHPAGQRPAGRVSPLARRVQRERQAAALAQRGETAVNLAAVACFLALLAAVLIAVDEDAVAGIPIPDGLASVLTYLSVISVGAITAALLASAVNEKKTPLTVAVDVMWDLMCFLPRSAHPLGPASYAERAVPEIRGRIDSWLHGTDLPGDSAHDLALRREIASRRRVVLSAHSMGCTLAVAAVFIRSGNPVAAVEIPDTTHEPLQAFDVVSVPRTHPSPGDGRVGLLTYGSQLRAYFGRFFPDLFGSQTLGTTVCPGPALHGDPWVARQAAGSDATPNGTVGGTSLVGLLRAPSLRNLGDGFGADHAMVKPAWINLWRRTDVLGFPVDSYTNSDIDRGAEEVDRGSYLFQAIGHEAYWRSLAYHRGLDEVVSRLAPQREAVPVTA
jgi:hypothetical protein